MKKIITMVIETEDYGYLRQTVEFIAKEVGEAKIDGSNKDGDESYTFEMRDYDENASYQNIFSNLSR